MDILIETLQLLSNSWFIYLIFGLLFGSFLNVVIYRVPIGKSIVSPPSSCPVCKTQIKWYDNIPVLSWLVLGGKCRVCKTKISWQYPLVELVVGLMTMSFFFYYGASYQLFIIIPLSYILFSITIIDYKTYSIPSSLQYSILILAIITISLDFFYDESILQNLDVISSILGGVTGFSILFLIQIVGKKIYKQDAMGGGDVYLLAFSGLFLGPKNTLMAFILGAILSIVFYIFPTIINYFKKNDIVKSFLDESKMILLKKGIKLSGIEKFKITALNIQILFSMGVSNKDKFRGLISGLAKSIKEFKDDEKNSKTIISDDFIIFEIELFFRYLAIEEKELAKLTLSEVHCSKVDLKALNLLLEQDLIGYDLKSENYKLLLKTAKEVRNSSLEELLVENKDLLSDYRDIKFLKIDEIKKGLKEFYPINTGGKIEYLLNYNRIFQLSGYTKEQLEIVSLVKDLEKDLSQEQKIEVYCDMGYVYYYDMYYKEFEEEKIKIKNLYTTDSNSSFEVINFYLKLALFRAFFYKQKLAFGPYLAAGILIAFMVGDKIIDFYMNFMQDLFRI